MERYPDKITCTYHSDLTTVLKFPGIPPTCALVIEYPNFNFDIDETRNRSIKLVSEGLTQWDSRKKFWLGTNKSNPPYPSKEFKSHLSKLETSFRFDGLYKTDFTFFHAGQCPVSELENHTFFFNGFSGSFFVLFTTDDTDTMRTFLIKWQNSKESFPANIILVALEMNAVIIFFLGAFDDPAIDTIICGQPETVLSMRQFVQEACDAAN